jgi:hypothetical protein
LSLAVFVEVVMSEESKGTIVSFKEFAAQKKAAKKKSSESSEEVEELESTDSWLESVKKRNADAKSRLRKKRKSNNKQVLSSYRIK